MTETTAPAAVGPAHWAADVLATDGGVVHLRPISPDDGDALVEFHAALSERTRYLRYFGPHPRLSPREVAHATNVDHRNRVAFVAELGGEIIGLGLYERLFEIQTPSAEVAFVIADSHQGRGLGSILLEHLAGAAAENGIEVFVAEVLAENRGMVSVFRDAGYEVKRSIDGSVVHLEFAVDPTEALQTVRDSREAASEARSVRNLLSPGSVAVIGASATHGKVGNVVATNIVQGAFTGPSFPVNRSNHSVHGVFAYPTVRDIPIDVDLAVVAVSADQIDSVLDDCLAKGVKGLVVLSAGFGETGPAGYEAERRLARAARNHGMRLVGPSALGIANNHPDVRLNATLAPRLPGYGRVGFFCQSGPLGAAILAEAAERGIGLSTFVSAGNRADLSGNDLLQYWDTDEHTDLVLLYLESFGNPRKFSRIARRVTRHKPIVAVRSGRAPMADAAIDESVARDLVKQAGIIQVETISELFDVAVMLEYQPLPAGPRVAVVDNSAAIGWMAADTATAGGLTVAEPVHLGPTASPDAYEAAVSAALGTDADAVIAIIAPPVDTPLGPFGAALKRAAARATKPVLVSQLATEGISDALTIRGPDGNPVAGSIPAYPDPQRAARALAWAVEYAAWRAKPMSSVVRPAELAVDAAREKVARWLTADPAGRWLSDDEVVELLGCYGATVVEYRPVTSVAEAVAAAADLGLPVAAKATGRAWRIRPDLRGVRLNLSTSDAVATAYRDLAEISGRDQVHIQQMAPQGVGCVIRVGDDASFGSVISFGLSGLISELLGDRAYRALPLTEADAAELVEAPRAAPLLSGYLGTDPVDKAALLDLLQRISALCDDVHEIRQLACEPVMVSDSGASILFARIRIGPEPSQPDLGPRRLA